MRHCNHKGIHMTLKEKAKDESWGFCLMSRNEEDDFNTLGLYGFGYAWYFKLNRQWLSPCFCKEAWGKEYKKYPYEKSITCQWVIQTPYINTISIGRECEMSDKHNFILVNWNIPWFNERFIRTQYKELSDDKRYYLLADIHNEDNLVLAYHETSQENTHRKGNPYSSNWFDKLFNKLSDKFKLGEKIYRRVNVVFNQETGERVGTYKGGTLSTSYYAEEGPTTNTRADFYNSVQKDFRVEKAYRNTDEIPEEIKAKTTAEHKLFGVPLPSPTKNTDEVEPSTNIIEQSEKAKNSIPDDRVDSGSYDCNVWDGVFFGDERVRRLRGDEVETK